MARHGEIVVVEVEPRGGSDDPVTGHDTVSQAKAISN